MLDIRRIRENPEAIRDAVARRGKAPDIEGLIALDSKRRELMTASDKLKHQRNQASQQIGVAKKAGEDASAAIAEMKQVGEQIAKLQEQIREVDEQQQAILLEIPNVPQESVPDGLTEENNRLERSWGEIKEHDFEAVEHKAFGESLDLFDFTRGAKISGSGFPVYKGLGARLERALINYFLDRNTQEFGFTEVIPPYLVTRQTMTGTGQLPKFEEDMYHCTEDDLFLIPTAEVPVTNLLAREVLAEEDLPVSMCAYSACFRREAGSYGKDVRGLLRLHQFNKVEMVKFTAPEDSQRAHEELVSNAEKMLQALGLTYRVITLCAGDLGFSASKCYDLEVWAPVEQKWLEVSSVSNFEDFQARRAQIKYRSQGKNKFVHTLNGSGLATPRVMVALLDTWQQADGSLLIPEVLRPFMGMDKIEPKPKD